MKVCPQCDHSFAGLTETAIEAAKRIRFQPAQRDGRPISVRANLEYNFALY